MQIKTPVLMALLYTNSLSGKGGVELIKSSMSEEDYLLFCKECVFQQIFNNKKPTSKKIFSEEQVVSFLMKTKEYAKKFINKVESGRAHSTETYSDMKELSKMLDELVPFDAK